jgi:hypothetical protein
VDRNAARIRAAIALLEEAGETELAGFVRSWSSYSEVSRRALGFLTETFDKGPRGEDES